MNERKSAVAGRGILIIGAVVTLVLTLSDCPAQTNASLTLQPTNEIHLTFTNRQGRVYDYIKVLKILPDGILYTVTDGAGGGKINFADMPDEYQRMFSSLTPVELLKTEANKGDVEAMMQLGLLYAAGKGVPTNAAEAEQWYTRAAKLGNSNAAMALGRIFMQKCYQCDGAIDVATGLPLPKTKADFYYKQAVQWFRQAAEGGDPYGQIELSHYYYQYVVQGAGAIDPATGLPSLPVDPFTGLPADTNAIKTNEAEAFKWYDKAYQTLVERAKHGDQSAQLKLRQWRIDAPSSWVISNNLTEALLIMTKPSTPPRAATGELSDTVLTGIKQSAAREWPNDYEMQQFKIKQQLTAFSELQQMSAGSVPADVFERIKTDAANEWPGDYEMQVFKIKTQVKAYLNLQK